MPSAKASRSIRPIVSTIIRPITINGRDNRSPKMSWLLHAERNLAWDQARATATIRGPENKASLTAQLFSPGVTFRGAVTQKFPVPVDPKYVKAEDDSSYITGTWHEQAHLTVES